jgi:hypothetical protein
MRQPLRPDRRKVPLRVDARCKEALEDLRHYVENLNKSPQLVFKNGIYQAKDPEQVFTTTVDNVEFGYQLKDLGGPWMRRTVFIKLHGHRWADLAEHEQEAILTAAMEAFIDQQQKAVDVQTPEPDLIVMQQDFSVAMLVRNPARVSVFGGGTRGD